MRHYTQLAQEQRYQIYALMKAGHTQTRIASIVGVHKSTISRELLRNKGLKGYRPKQAQRLATLRKVSKHTPRIAASTWQLVEKLIEQDWSPEQISNWLRLNKYISVSHERIYQYILHDKSCGGKLYPHLRCQKQRKKRYGTYSRRGQIPNKISIDQRPAIVDKKSRIGDWEVDTIVGKKHKQAIVSLTERKTKLAFISKVERKTARLVSDATIHLLGSVQNRVKTITSDNGREVVRHEQLAQELNAQFYFAHPYASWERGLNENTNGLIRQYFPKQMDFQTITDSILQKVMDKLNNRPRKTLGYQTTNQLFFGLKPNVALRI